MIAPSYTSLLTKAPVLALTVIVSIFAKFVDEKITALRLARRLPNQEACKYLV